MQRAGSALRGELVNAIAKNEDAEIAKTLHKMRDAIDKILLLEEK
jgi:hypothetical protein